MEEYQDTQEHLGVKDSKELEVLRVTVDILV